MQSTVKLCTVKIWDARRGTQCPTEGIPVLYVEVEDNHYTKREKAMLQQKCQKLLNPMLKGKYMNKKLGKLETKAMR